MRLAKRQHLREAERRLLAPRLPLTCAAARGASAVRVARALHLHAPRPGRPGVGPSLSTPFRASRAYPALWGPGSDRLLGSDGRRWHGGHSHVHVAHPPAGAEASEEQDEERRRAIRVTNAGAATNVALMAAKAVAGFLANSPALLADAVHSMSDLVTDAVTVASVHFSRQPADAEHPYGHGRFETLGAFSVGALLVVASGGMAVHSFNALMAVLDGAAEASQAGTALTVAACGVAGASIVLKEGLYRWTMKVARDIRSQVLIANAWHHRSDAMSSIVALGGITGSLYGMPLLDPIAGIAVAAMIGQAGVKVAVGSIRELSDTADPEVIRQVGEILDSHSEVQEVRRLRSRRMGPYVLVDTLVRVSRRLSVSAAHHVAESIQADVLRDVPGVSEVMVAVTTHESEEARQAGLAGLRTHSEIEADVNRVALIHAGVLNVAHTRVHFQPGRVSVELEIFVDPEQSVRKAAKIASSVRRVVEGIPDVDEADVHLELDDVFGSDGGSFPHQARTEGEAALPKVAIVPAPAATVAAAAPVK